MDIPFINLTKHDFLHKCLLPSIKQENKKFIVTANPEIVMKTKEDPSYKNAVLAADYVVPDGVGILMAAKHQKEPLQERVSGYDIMMDLLSYADQQALSCYFLGASEMVNEKAVTEVKKRYPNLKIAGHHHGFFDLDDEQVAADVKNAAADIVFVALGLPRQEMWIHQHLKTFEKGIFMGVGGSFDVLAGEVKRAPQFWIKLNLEWLYRIIKQPFRIKRIFKVFEFMFRTYLRLDK